MESLKGGLEGLKGRKFEKDGQARFDIEIGGSAFGPAQEEIRPETQQSTEVEDILSVRKCWRMDYRPQPSVARQDITLFVGGPQ